MIVVVVVAAAAASTVAGRSLPALTTYGKSFPSNTLKQQQLINQSS